MWNGKQRQSGVKRARCASVRLPGSAGGGLWLRRLLTIPPGGAALDSAWCGPHCAGGGEETRRGCAAQRGREAAEARGGGAGEAAAGRSRGRAAARRTSAPPVAHRSQLSPTAAVCRLCSTLQPFRLGHSPQEEKEQRDLERKAKKEAKRAIRLAKKAEAIAAGLPAEPGDFPQQLPRAFMAVATTHAQAIRTFRC